ncbi:MAG: MlaD family protein [Treponema sp.]|jgi:phospholipid/cholesterol/gamma-HCH transport system substrate-binding protein|nr:MlaD family protein [Treponema sp.]
MNISRYVKIALFFIVLGTAGGAYIIISADGLSDFNTRMYEVVLQDATGLSTRSKVYLAGVAVGRVRGVTLKGNEAYLQVAFLKNVEIREDAKISRRSSSILGTSVLTLNPGSDLSPLIQPGSRIDAEKNAGDIGQIIGLVQEMGGQISQLLKSFQENQLALLEVSLETFNSIAGKIDAQSDEELERISRILESVALITERVERLLAQGETAGTGPAADIYGSLENIRMITDEIRRGQGNVGRIVYDDQLYSSILAAVQRIEVAAEKLQTALDTINTVALGAGEVIDNANVIVERAAGLGLQVDTYGSYNVLAEQASAGASIRLTPASDDRWYRIGVSSVPDGYSNRTVREITDENGVRSVRDITETKYSFAIDAELARRFGHLTFRGGLRENTAGLGLDIQPVRWASVSGDVFDFKTGETPNLRGTLTLYPFFDPNSDKPWNWIYLKGGINNSLSENRDYFIGGGVRFADREIKGLVGLVPAMNSLSTN